MPVLLYGSETMIWREERPRIRAVQMDNLRGLWVLGDWMIRCMKVFSDGTVLLKEWGMIAMLKGACGYSLSRSTTGELD